MAQKPLPTWRRSLAAPKAHRTQRRMKNGDWYMRISAGRHAGAVKLFECTGMTKTECEQQIVDAHADLLKTERILDLEDQLRSVTLQHNKLRDEIERLRGF